MLITPSGEGWTYFGAIGYEPEGSKHALNLSVLGAGSMAPPKRCLGINS